MGREASTQLRPGDPAQIVVQQRHLLVEGGAATVLESQQQLGHVADAVHAALLKWGLLPMTTKGA